MAGGMGHTGGLTIPRPWHGRCRAGSFNTSGPLLPRKRLPFFNFAQTLVNKFEQNKGRTQSFWVILPFASSIALLTTDDHRNYSWTPSISLLSLHQCILVCYFKTIKKLFLYKFREWCHIDQGERKLQNFIVNYLIGQNKALKSPRILHKDSLVVHCFPLKSRRN